jgi:hypothetical protein
MNISVSVGILNIILGFVYLQYGTMTIVEMARGWKTMGFSHFGAAWIALAFTCGPHHMVHGIHILEGGGSGGVLDFVAVAVGFPAGVTWFLLRVEAFQGGRGDRFISGTPFWLMVLPVAAGAYAATVVAVAASTGNSLHWTWVVIPNFLLICVYMSITYFLARTQLGNRPGLGGWSVSGLALTVIFPTCAVMHAVYTYYALIGQYGTVHAYAIDWVGVPAGIYFLWVVRGLYREALADWNSVSTEPVAVSGRRVSTPTPAAATG